MTPHADSGSFRASIAIRVARCWSSTLYFLGAAMTLIILPRIESLHQTRGDSLVALVVQHLALARIAEALAVSWNTANDAVLAGTGPARLLDMVEGRSKAAFKAWLAPRPKAWRDGMKVGAMDGFTRFKTAANEKLPTATTVMDPFHIARLARDTPNQYRHHVQQKLHRHRGQADDPLFRARRTLHTSTDLLTEQQQVHLRGVVHRR